MEGHVKTEIHGGITTIEFFHPQANSLPGKLLEQLAQTIHGTGNDEDTKVIILRSGGDKSFCGGASFNELVAIETAQQGMAFFSGFAHVINAMRTCPQFIIGRIHGKCVGGGVGLAAACDYAIAAESADIKLSELNVGIGPFVVGPAVERKIGVSAFSQLAIDASQWRSADWARRKGLYAELHPSVQSMDDYVQRLAGSLAQASPNAMAEMKKILWKGTENWHSLLPERAAISGRLILDVASKNAVRKMLEKKT